MSYKFTVMTQEEAEDIAFNWHYDDEYSFYDMEADQEDLDEFLNQEKRGTLSFSVTKEKDLIGFLSINRIDDKTLDIALGMRPDLTGLRKGEGFLRKCIDFLNTEYEPLKITLSVATFNKRAIKVYKKVGFIGVQTFMQETNGSTFEFLKMEYKY
ncbi:GNAT family N-acetyltransferase [Gracilibacillus thailandensis]|uniref:GNAT family N-acetyltransferase n=1 Tax=Gracilibacillus thailandensis TaxID=563735 RepID=A0A6N7QUT8_9BACI|nr:GNAT family protein [Gracilibacillus thailandensis]MRI65768.1 GNAT family N-acetyltransferase [Gracilibacillus thailandensis]